MIENADIIVVGLQPWDIAIGSNSRNIALELSHNNNVLYVNPPLDRSTLLNNRNSIAVQKRMEIIKGNEKGLVKISNTLHTLYPSMLAESINWIPWKPVFNWMNLLNNKRLAKNIREAIQTLGFRDYILFNDQSMIRCYYLNELLQPAGFIYYIRDNLNTIPYFRKHGVEMEAELIARADVVATNSGYLAEYARQYNRKAEMVGQGCDFTLYDDPKSTPVADELRTIRAAGPVIGYTGYLTSLRLDIALIEQVAASMKNCQFVLVGPEDDDFKRSRLHQFKNVYFTGNKNPEELPQYIKGFDVAFNPQLVNEVTMGNYPRKIDEYLAMGKPVVATSTPFMSYFKDHTYLGSSADEYIMLIQKALGENSELKEQERRMFALQHTWENNVNAIGKLLNDSMKLKEN
jgi:teichuronic acid biosynthesis glycosyltransferase TuaH